VAEASGPTTVEDRSLRELVAQLSRDGSTLLRQEIALAKTELGESAKRLRQAVVAAATGALVMYAGALTLLAALVLLLGQVMPTWLSALLVGGVVTLVGVVLLGRGKAALDRVEVLPKQAMDNVERDVEMMKEAVR